MVVNHQAYHRKTMQRGITLVELVLSVVISAMIMSGLNSIVKLGLDAQTIGRSRNELAYQGRFALERMTDKARNTPAKELSTPAANTTGDWFAPTMYCRNSTTKQLIETKTTDTSCSGTVIASNVTEFSADIPRDLQGKDIKGVVDRHNGVINITMQDGTNRLPLLTYVRLGGGTQ